jgi:hypothetical protein
MGNNVTSSGTWSLGPSAPEGVNISNHGILTYSNVKAGNYIFDINFSYAGKAVSYRIEFLAHKLW